MSECLKDEACNEVRQFQRDLWQDSEGDRIKNKLLVGCESLKYLKIETIIIYTEWKNVLRMWHSYTWTECGKISKHGKLLYIHWIWKLFMYTMWKNI